MLVLWDVQFQIGEETISDRNMGFVSAAATKGIRAFINFPTKNPSKRLSADSMQILLPCKHIQYLALFYFRSFERIIWLHRYRPYWWKPIVASTLMGKAYIEFNVVVVVATASLTPPRDTSINLSNWGHLTRGPGNMLFRRDQTRDSEILHMVDIRYVCFDRGMSLTSCNIQT